MGINSLLKHLGPISEPTALKALAGKTFAVDGYSWLHKSIFTCPEELCTNKPAKAYITYFSQRYEKLKKQNIHLYMVFDGYPLGAKMNTNLGRREDRESNRVLAEEYKLKGDTLKAREFYSRACPVTAHMAKSWINFCVEHSIPYIVAPFEADSQMVYLEKLGLVDGIISEDSDLLIFGCETLVTKLDLNTESCVLIERKNFPLMENDVDKKGNPKFPIGQLSQTDLYNVVCLSGCDYTPGVYLIGLLKAIKLLKEYNFSMDLAIAAIQTTYKQKLMKKKDAVNPIPENYLEDVLRAKICFAYMFVFDPLTEKVTTLNPLPENPLSLSEKFFEYIGPLVTEKGVREVISHIDEIDHKVHKLISLGEIHQFTLEKLLDRESQLVFDYRNQIAVLKNKALGNLDEIKIIERTISTEDLLSEYEKKSLKFILPLFRSTTVDNYCNKQLERMAENRMLVTAKTREFERISVDEKSRNRGSKFFKRKRSISKSESVEVSLEQSKVVLTETHNDYYPVIESPDKNENINEISITNPNHLFIDFSEEKDLPNLKSAKKSNDLISSNSDSDGIVDATIEHKSQILETISKFSYIENGDENKSEILEREIKKTVFTKTVHTASDQNDLMAGQIIISPQKNSLNDSNGGVSFTSPVKLKDKIGLLGTEYTDSPSLKGNKSLSKRDFSSLIEPIEYIQDQQTNTEQQTGTGKDASWFKKFEYQESDNEGSSSVSGGGLREICKIKKTTRTLARSTGNKLLTSDRKPDVQKIAFSSSAFIMKAKKR